MKTLIMLICSAMIAVASAADEPLRRTGFIDKAVALIDPCAFRLQIPEVATLVTGEELRTSGSIAIENPRNLRTKNYIEPFRISFLCKPLEVYSEAGGPVRYDLRTKTWINDVEAYVREQSDPEPDLADDDKLRRSFHFYYVGPHGYIYTADRIFGEEKFRPRTIFFCFSNATVAVCNIGDEVGYLEEIARNRRMDLTPLALRMIYSIEFSTSQPTDPWMPPLDRAASVPIQQK